MVLLLDKILVHYIPKHLSLLMLSCMLLCLQAQQVRSQKAPIETWLEQLNTQKDTAKLLLLDKIYQYYKSKQLVRALRYSQQATELSNVTSIPPIYQAIAKRNEAEAKYLQSKYKEAAQIAQQAYNIFEEQRALQFKIQTLNLMGNIQQAQGNQIQATNHLVNALQIAENQKLNAEVALTLNNLGRIYEGNGNTLKAIENYAKALQIYEKLDINNEEGKGETYANLGRMAYAQKNYTQALDLFSKSLSISEKWQNDRNIAEAEHGIAKIFFQRENYPKTLEKLQKVLKIYENLSNKKALAQVQKDLAKTYQRLEQPDKALEFAQKSIKIAQTIDLQSEIMEASQILASIYYEKQDFQRAYDYQLQYLALKDTLFNHETNKTIANLQSSYELEKKQQEIALLNREKELEKKMFAEREAQKLRERALEQKKVLAEQERLERNIKFGKVNEERLRKEKEKQAQEYRRNEAMRKAQIELMQKNEANERNIRYFLIAVLLLVAMFGYYLFITNKQKKAVNEKLQRQNEEIKIQREELHLKKEILEAQNEIIESKNRDIESSIIYAKRIQDAILPTEEQMQEHLKEYFVLFKPRDIVSGDFYWFGEVQDEQTKQYKIIIAAADCTGHGVPGAFMSMIGDVLLSQIVLEKHITEPDVILNEMNKGIRKALKQKQVNQEEGDHKVTQDGMDIALCMIDKANKILEYAGARSPMYLVQNGQMIDFKPDKMPIGGYQMGEGMMFGKQTHLLTTNCWIYMASDGYQDQFNGQTGKKFKSNKFKELLLKNHTLPATEQKKILDDTIEAWKGGENQLDDILVIGVNINFDS